MTLTQLIALIVVFVVIPILCLLPDFMYMLEHPGEEDSFDDEDTYIKL